MRDNSIKAQLEEKIRYWAGVAYQDTQDPDAMFDFASGRVFEDQSPIGDYYRSLSHPDAVEIVERVVKDIAP